MYDADPSPGASVRRSVLVLASFLAACGTSTDDTAEDTPRVIASDLDNPLSPDVPLFPWPSDQYLVPDDTTRTGVRMQVPAGRYPDGMNEGMFSSEDGFSRVVPIMTWLDGGFDPATLPDATDWGATTKPDSAVLLVRVAANGNHVLEPMLVETDATEDDPVHAALLLRAHRALAPESTHVVILRSAVKKADGSAHSQPPAVASLLSGDVEDESRAVQAHAPSFETVRQVLEDLTIPADDVIQAWTFTTKSEASAIADAIAMQDVAATASTDSYALEAPTDQGEGCSPNCVVIRGTFQVPWFLDENNRIVRGEDGLPVVQGTKDAPLFITIPKQIEGPRPVVLFGHGFFSAVEEPTWGNLFGGLTHWDMSAVTTKFYGFAEVDLIESAKVLGADMSNFGMIPDQQLQSHANFTVLHRLITEHLADEISLDLGNGDIKPLDGTNVPYMGISNGGTQGLVMMTTSPVLDRGGLVVPGGGWSHMLQRAAQWNELGLVFSGRFTDSHNMQVAMSMMQQLFDPVDSLNYVEHLIDNRLEGRPEAPELLMVEAVNDSQVANMVTRWVANTSQFPLITPSIADVWGIPTVTADGPDGAPAGIGYEIYDLGVPDNPSGNVAPTENGVHNDVRLRLDYKDQMGAFLEDGTVLRTCEGACGPLD